MKTSSQDMMNNILSNKIQYRNDAIKICQIMHDRWREKRKQSNGTYKPKIKILIKKEDGIEHWYNQDYLSSLDVLAIQDIAKNDFDHLHYKWKEKKINYTIDVIKTVKRMYAQDIKDLEDISSEVHKQWMANHPKNKTNMNQYVPYESLSEEEKEKDRELVRIVLEVLDLK